MEKIFYAERTAYPTSEKAIQKILREFYQLPDPSLSRTQTGKPYLVQNAGLYFSVSHTDSLLFIAVSDTELGIDAEMENREVDYLPILKKFPTEERGEITNSREFIQRWVIKESAVKYLGGTLAKDLAKLRFSKNKLFYGENELPVRLRVTTFRGHCLSICSKRDFENAEWIEI